MRIRVVATASGKYAVQVVSKHYGKLTVHKHVGTYSNESEKLKLFKQAKDYIAETTHQGNLLEIIDSWRPSEVAITESRPLLVYHLLAEVYDQLGLNKCPDPLIKDLVEKVPLY